MGKRVSDDLQHFIFRRQKKILNEIFSQKQKINQFNIDSQELEFLKLNLEHGHKCRKSFLNTDGFKVGTEEYKDCVLNGGRKGG